MHLQEVVARASRGQLEKVQADAAPSACWDGKGEEQTGGRQHAARFGPGSKIGQMAPLLKFMPIQYQLSRQKVLRRALPSHRPRPIGQIYTA